MGESDTNMCRGCAICSKGFPTKDQKINCSQFGLVEERQECPSFDEYQIHDISLKNFRID